MRISGLFGPVIALVALTPVAPAHADISPGDLMYTDLFRWSDWRQILAKFDCTEELTFYLWNAPSPPRPIIIPPTPAIDPVVAAFSTNLYGTPGGGAGSGAIVPVDLPIGTPGGGAPVSRLLSQSPQRGPCCCWASRVSVMWLFGATRRQEVCLLRTKRARLSDERLRRPA